MIRFQSIIGHARAKKTLLATLSGKRPAHAFLFTGPAGVGKKSMAMAMAAFVLCRNPTPEQDACGSCASCRKIAGDSHPDCLVVRPDGAGIRIGQVRALIRTLDFSPHEGGVRVVILEDAHTLGREAANSLLKTLEEPPPGNLFVLVVDAGRPVLPTIRSRCQAILFPPLLPDQLTTVVCRERPEYTREEALNLAAVADGSPGRALALAEDQTASFRRTLLATLFMEEQGGLPIDIRFAGLAQDAAEEYKQTGMVCAFLYAWHRDLLLLSAGIGEQALVNRDFSRQLEKEAATVDHSELFSKIGYIQRAEQELARNCNAAHVFLVLFYRLINAPGAVWNR